MAGSFNSFQICRRAKGYWVLGDFDVELLSLWMDEPARYMIAEGHRGVARWCNNREEDDDGSYFRLGGRCLDAQSLYGVRNDSLESVVYVCTLRACVLICLHVWMEAFAEP